MTFFVAGLNPLLIGAQCERFDVRKDDFTTRLNPLLIGAQCERVAPEVYEDGYVSIPF